MLDELATLLEGYPATIYDAVQCPLSGAARDVLRAAYGPGIERIARLLPAGWDDRLRAEVERVLSRDRVDFAFLGVAEQADLLRRAGDRGLLRELQQANAPLLKALRTTPMQLPARDRQIDELFGEAAFARRVAAALGPLLTAQPAAGAGETAQPEAVRRFFAGPATLRLLMES